MKSKLIGKVKPVTKIDVKKFKTGKNKTIRKSDVKKKDDKKAYSEENIDNFSRQIN